MFYAYKNDKNIAGSSTKEKLIKLCDKLGISDYTISQTAPQKKLSFEQSKIHLKNKVDKITASKITGGFVSTCYNGESILYDTDIDTQITMQFAKNCCDSDRFAEELPNGLEVRGYEQVDVDEDGTLVFSKDKTIYYFSPEQIKTWNEDFALFLRECKKEGWMKQAEVNACTTKEELAKVDLNW